METTTPTGACATAPSPTRAEMLDDVPGNATEALEAVEAVEAVDAMEDMPGEDVEYVVRRRRRETRSVGPIIAPVIGVGGLGAAVVAPMGGGIGVALPIGGTTPAPQPAPAAPAVSAPCACASPATATDAPVTVASPDPVTTTPTEAEDTLEGTWIVTERDALQAAESWIAAAGAESDEAWTESPLVETNDEAFPEHVDEYDEIAEQAVLDAPLQTAARFVADLLARAGMSEIEAEIDEHADLAARLPARLFDYFNGRNAMLPASLAGRFEVVAAPGMPLGALSAGDWLVRRGDGGYAHVAVLASPNVWPASALHRSGFRTERATQGGYVHVIEPGPLAAQRDDRFARRVCDRTRRVLPDTLVLRPQRALPRPRIPLDEFDESVDARWIQQALNRILGIDLAVDGVLGPQSRAAIRSFQAREGLAPDGIVGPRTEGALQRALGNVSGTGVTTQGGPPTTRPGGSTPPATSDCTTLDDFDQGRDTLKPPHHTLLIGVARRIQRERIRLLDITGFASSEGDEGSNFALGLRRATSVMQALRETLERMRPGSSAGVVMIPVSRGESDQVAGGSLPRNRRVVICPRRIPAPPVQPVRTRLFVVTGKSFIARIGSNIGSLDCGIPIPSITIPGLDISTPSMIPGASNTGLRALAVATDIALDENPTDDRIFSTPPPESKGYRLFSQGRVQAMTRGTQLVNLSLDTAGLRTDTGKECLPGTSVCLQAPPMRIDQPFSTQRLDASRIRFRWKVAGEPHRDAKRPFDIICERRSTFIWHEIVGTVDASSGTPEITNIFIQGSRFPTHRLWVDNVVRGRVPQNEFSALWDGTPGEPTRVR